MGLQFWPTSDGGGIMVNGSTVVATFSPLGVIILPSFTTTARDALSGPVAGSLIYNSTTNKVNVRVAAAWEAVTSA